MTTLLDKVYILGQVSATPSARAGEEAGGSTRLLSLFPTNTTGVNVRISTGLKYKITSIPFTGTTTLGLIHSHRLLYSSRDVRTRNSRSSPLEVELHDGETEQEGEHHGENNVHHCHGPQEVMMEAEVLRDIRGHGLVWACASVEFMMEIAKLGGNQSV